eukprot:scaffold7970_cov187-Amphora_coffeaeformis.AAC.4
MCDQGLRGVGNVVCVGDVLYVEDIAVEVPMRNALRECQRQMTDRGFQILGIRCRAPQEDSPPLK